jgi:hypothetical protein
MHPPHSRAIASALGVLLAATALVASGQPAGGPFYLVPSPTKECLNVSNCEAEAGPWVVVRAHGEASYLLSCPRLRGYIVGGTDARTSSPGIRVWFDGQVGGAGGFPTVGNPTGAALLFHAVADNGSGGSFQPILGCVSLKNESKVATVSLVRPLASPGVAAGPPLDLRASRVVIGPQAHRITSVGCPRDETLVGGWGAVAFETVTPPAARYTRAVSVTTVLSGRTVHAFLQIGSIMTAPFTGVVQGSPAPEAWVQVGAMCQP